MENEKKESSTGVAEEVAVSKAQQTLSVTVYDIYWLGITIVIGGQLVSWNTALEQGFWQMFLAATIVMGLGYMSLVFCIGEMTSILSFAGGSYGFTRAILGPTTGYLVGVSEAVEYVMYVASAAASFGDLCVLLFDNDSDFARPLYFLLLYAITVPIHIYGGRPFWLVSTLLGILGLVLIVLYCLATIKDADISDTQYQTEFTGGMHFMRYLHVTAWFYIGIEAMTLGNNNIKDAGNKVPFAMAACVCTLFVTAICIMLCVASTPPGTEYVKDSVLPLEYGYRLSLKCTKRVAALLMLPGIIGTAYGFQFAYTRQLNAMASSGLIPKFISGVWGPNSTPAAACLLGSFMSLALLLGCYRAFDNFSAKLFGITMFGSCCVYINLFRSYLICHERYSNMERSFSSPFGRVGAYVGMLIFSLVLIGLAFFQDDNYTSLAAFIIFMMFAVAYYFGVAQNREFFSKEEQDKFMKAYILNANVKNKKSRNKSKSTSVGILKGLNKVLPSSMQFNTASHAAVGKSMVSSNGNGNKSIASVASGNKSQQN